MEVQLIFSEKCAKLLNCQITLNFQIPTLQSVGKQDGVVLTPKVGATQKIYTSEDKKTILEFPLDHNHEPATTIARQAITNSVKRKAVEDCTKRSSKLIHKELTNNAWALDIGSDILLLVRRNLYEAWRDVLPA